MWTLVFTCGDFYINISQCQFLFVEVPWEAAVADFDHHAWLDHRHRFRYLFFILCWHSTCVTSSRRLFCVTYIQSCKDNQNWTFFSMLVHMHNIFSRRNLGFGILSWSWHIICHKLTHHDQYIDEFVVDKDQFLCRVMWKSSKTS